MADNMITDLHGPDRRVAGGFDDFGGHVASPTGGAT